MPTNWAGNVEFQAARVHRPTSLEELRRTVAAAERVRTLGTGHSFNRLADTEHDLVLTSGLPHEVEIDGHVGYYCAGMNTEATVRIAGNCGVGVAENMMSGTVVVDGSASQSAADSTPTASSPSRHKAPEGRRHSGLTLPCFGVS